MEGLSTQYNGHIINEIIYIEKFWENFNKNTTFKVKGHTCGNLKDIHLSIRRIRNILTIQSERIKSYGSVYRNPSNFQSYTFYLI